MSGCWHAEQFRAAHCGASSPAVQGPAEEGAPALQCSLQEGGSPASGRGLGINSLDLSVNDLSAQVEKLKDHEYSLSCDSVGSVGLLEHSSLSWDSGSHPSGSQGLRQGQGRQAGRSWTIAGTSQKKN